MYFIGMDPGAGGGIAMVGDGYFVMQRKMPATEMDVLEFIRELASFGPTRAVIERVRSSPQMGVVSAFTFGRGYGALRMATLAAAIPFDEVTPAVWQRVMGCLSKGDKNVTKARAQELFPGITVTHAVADALLLAEYCRRTYQRRTGV